MLWSGDGKGNNQHCVRLINFNTETFTYMDSTFNVINIVKNYDLNEYTPAGCNMIIVSKKKILILEQQEIQKEETRNLEGITYYIPEDYKNFIQSDDALFHYTKKGIAIENILPQKRLRGSSLLNFSDFREGIVPRVVGTWWGDEDKSKNMDIINYNTHILKSQSKVFCFCSNSQYIEDIKATAYFNPNIRQDYYNFYPVFGFHKSRMWDYYAEGYSGTCLVFDKRQICETLKGSNLYYKKASEIEYYKDYFSRINANDLGNNVEDEALALLKNLIFIEDYDYRDENEFRILMIPKSDDSDVLENGFLDISNSLKGIILGHNFPEIYIDLVKKLMSGFPGTFILKFEYSDYLPYIALRGI